MAEAPHIELKQDIQAHSRRKAVWLLILSSALIVVVAGIGFAVFNSGNRTIARPPAILATPSVVPGVAPPPPETTTGNAPKTYGQASPR